MALVSRGDVWQGDRLGRQQDAESVYRFIMSQVEARRLRGGKASYVLNINAEWGHGKSFFLHRFATQLAHDGHVVAQVNAWENDLANEPMIAVMAAIEDGLKPHLSAGSKVRAKWKALMKASGPLAVSLMKGVATSFLKKHTGEFLSEATNRLDSDQKATHKAEAEAESSPIGEGAAAVFEKLGDDLAARMIEAHKQHLNSIATFRNNLAAIAASMPHDENPDAKIFVLVDELDRCRPSHAINLLEAVKHLFNTDGVVFVIATNTSQLSASIKAVYGNDFNATDYLLRFFDRTYSFRDVPITDFVNFMFSTHGIPPGLYKVAEIDAVPLSVSYFEAVGLSLRDIEQCFEIFSTIHHLWTEVVPPQLPLLWPLIMAHHKGRTEAFRMFSGQDKTYDIKNFLTREQILQSKIVRHDERGRAIREIVTTSDLASRYLSGLHMPLSSLIEPGSGGSGYRIACGYFRQELRARYPGGYASDAPPWSVIATYADHIRLAVQFESKPDG
ncbi:KAP P-loop domain protein [Sphingopyxis sp. LC81]|uniref:KAP family P-loop NTPase fold protein n=1 Tax=Sphingopyxis sp. LC81 TaxID=1502850 RepID=UPI00050FF094|nr:P-loop NTPase fold protein [Sphingopyxis sp. LC81]KGB51783.1 KAP P-loop domain protein [Sphingopyxis sp. LC81]